MSRSVLITGAAAGNGNAISKVFFEKGWDVIGVDKHRPEDSSIFSDFIKLDLRNILDQNFSLKKLDLILKKSTCLVNNAGITLPLTEGINELELWDKTLEINLTIPYVLSKKFVGKLRSINKRYIVNICSLASHQGFPDNPSYHASKGGLLALTRSQAVDFQPFNINVNSISPGYIKTNMTAQSYQDPLKKELRSNRTILKKWGQPEDIARALFFLASGEGDYLTGTDIKVDGGWTSNGF